MLFHSPIPKRKNVLVIPILAGALMLVGVCYFQFADIFSFNFELDNNGQYFIAFVQLAGWTLLPVLLLLKRSLTIYQVAPLLIAMVIFFFFSCSRYYSFANEYFVHVSVIVLLFTVLIYSDVNTLNFIVLLFALSFLIQLGMAFVQMDGFSPYIRNFDINGSLQNPGVFCNYLVIQLPFLYYLLFMVKRKKEDSINKRGAALFATAKTVFFIGIFCFTVFIVWRTTTRTAMVMLASMVIVFYLQNYINALKAVISRIPKLILLVSAGVFVILLGIAGQYLFKLKLLSALGRMMRMDIAAAHVTDNFWLGTGIGRFTWFYPQWQAQYFAAHPFPSKEYVLTADESYIVFNEFLQLFETIGLMGMTCVGICLFLFFKTKSSKYRALLNTVKLTVAAILICCLFSYPLHVNMILLQLAFCFAVAITINEKEGHLFDVLKTKVTLPAARALLIGCIVAGSLITYTAFKNWHAINDWQHLQALQLSTSEMKNKYESLSTWLNKNGKFLTGYGTFLLLNGDCEKAAAVLENARKYFISRNTMEILAGSNQQCGNTGKAIENYEWLSNYIPGRFTIKFKLLKLYKESGDKSRAKHMALYILNMPVKIPSEKVDNIKAATMSILHEL